MNDAANTASKPVQIGIIVVHGIGEQRRFEHLDWQGRQIIQAIRAQDDVEVTVEIRTNPSSSFHGEQDTWHSGPHGPVQVFVKTKEQITHVLHFHEVWWADVNERYSIVKQIRFWLWGLAVWAYPVGKGDRLHGAAAVASPIAPELSLPFRRLWQRARLFMVGVLFLLAAVPLGIGFKFVQRLFGIKTPGMLKTLTNYISGVKLFNQRRRFGTGFSAEDILDTLDEPPRVSVRRRMIRTIATVARAKYDRWYIIAHSQGTVAAVNGLMESPYAWPGYFDKSGWNKFCIAGFGGPGNVPDIDAKTMPRRPVWAEPCEIAYRARIFQRFRGLLTLGSPVEKFAAIWPARVPVSLIAAFRANTVWLNIFDPMDPVSGVLNAFVGRPTAMSPSPENVGYAASPVLLLAHLRYLSGGLADGVAKWLLSDNPNHVRSGVNRFAPNSPRALRRTIGAWATWLTVFAVFALVGGLTIHWLWWELEYHYPGSCAAVFGGAESTAWLCKHKYGYDVLFALASAVAGTLLVGVVSSLLLFRNHKDSPSPLQSSDIVMDPDPSPPLLPPWT